MPFHRDMKVERLRAAPLFEGLSRKELAHLAAVTEDLDVPAGTVLCREGTWGREFFVIIDGEAEVSKGGKRVATCGTGDFFGEIALLEKVQRTATVTATTPLRFFVLTSQSFRPMLDGNPKIAGKILTTVARRLPTVTNDPTLS